MTGIQKGENKLSQSWDLNVERKRTIVYGFTAFVRWGIKFFKIEQVLRSFVYQKVYGAFTAILYFIESQIAQLSLKNPYLLVFKHV